MSPTLKMHVRGRSKGGKMAASAFAVAMRAASGILRPLNILASSAYQNCAQNACLSSVLSTRHFGHIQTPVVSSAPRFLMAVRDLTCGHTTTILNRVAPLLPDVLKLPPVRTVTYISSRKGKRKTVKAVIYRFLQLRSGLWLRRKAGYKKKLWKKENARKKRLREFVFCNKTQSKLLDKTTTSLWKRRNWYADDPYQKYHDRTNLKV
ncbi:39S ribosomal protein L35, mitochondrial [Tupaia chinensis]|uniref:Large ribosomal subunit protein bL35m n=1 Tax=Tupaia chinensis TaxID=246437 RepID=L9KMH5_TUPCH|nr:39S ribosomal protein L35, mitochondrial [Tupaia chinensis]